MRPLRSLALVSVACGSLALLACGTSTPISVGSGGGGATGGDAGAGGAGAAGGAGGAGASGGGGAGGAGASGGAGPVTCAGKRGATGSTLVTVSTSSGLRTAWVRVPGSYLPTQGAPVVLNFHGYGSDALQEELFTGMTEPAAARGMLVVYPYGVANSWNAGACCGTAWLDAVDDVAFVDALLDALEADWCVDPARVYATGMSNGGFFSHRLGCERADRIAAIAPVAGVLGVPCAPSRPVPVLHIHGTDDPLVPWGGGTPLLPWDVGPVNFVSVSDSMNAWRTADGCGPSSKVGFANGDASCEQWTCEQGAHVELCTISGGGHTWPSGLPVPTLGKTSTSLDATAAILDFFEAHPRP
jgi:polyhydroxybutyrate depolymerase